MILLALLLIAAPAQPPAPPPVPPDVYPTARGTMGVSFVLPGGEAKTIGGTYFFANDLAARVDFGLALPLTPSGPGQNKLFSLGVGLRSFQLKRNRVALFLQPGIALGREKASPAVSAEAALFVRFSGAAGVEYFFTNWFSAGATLELALKLGNLAGPAGTPVYSTVGTDTSSLSANIYF